MSKITIALLFTLLLSLNVSAEWAGRSGYSGNCGKAKECKSYAKILKTSLRGFKSKLKNKYPDDTDLKILYDSRLAHLLGNKKKDMQKRVEEVILIKYASAEDKAKYYKSKNGKSFDDMDRSQLIVNRVLDRYGNDIIKQFIKDFAIAGIDKSEECIKIIKKAQRKTERLQKKDHHRVSNFLLFFFDALLKGIQNIK